MPFIKESLHLDIKAYDRLYKISNKRSLLKTFRRNLRSGRIRSSILREESVEEKIESLGKQMPSALKPKVYLLRCPGGRRL